VTNSPVSASNLKGLEKVLKSKLVVIDKTSMSRFLPPLMKSKLRTSGSREASKLLGHGRTESAMYTSSHDILDFFLVRELQPPMLLTVPLRCNFEVYLVHLPLLISPSCYWEFLLHVPSSTLQMPRIPCLESSQLLTCGTHWAIYVLFKILTKS